MGVIGHSCCQMREGCVVGRMYHMYAVTVMFFKAICDAILINFSVISHMISCIFIFDYIQASVQTRS